MRSSEDVLLHAAAVMRSDNMHAKERACTIASVIAGMLDKAIEPTAATVAMPLAAVLKLPRTQPDVPNSKNTQTSSNAAETSAAVVLCATNSEYFMTPEP